MKLTYEEELDLLYLKHLIKFKVKTTRLKELWCICRRIIKGRSIE